MQAPLILASRSTIRRDLLVAAGLEIEVVPADIDERGCEAQWAEARLAPDAVARALAVEKALTVARTHPGRVVIGADQTMALAGERISKAATIAEARERLRTLRGRTHGLHSGFAVVRDGTVLAAGAASAGLTMRAFSDTFLDRYLERCGGDILASVGCYHLEGPGVTLFEAMEGDYFTVLGLPLLPLLAALRAENLVET